MMQKIGRLLSRITDLATVIGALGIALMMIHITLDVVLRYLFDLPLPGTIAIVSYYYMVIAAFVPLAFAEQKGAHISVEVVTERMPAWIQNHLTGWSYLLSAVIFGMLTVRTWGEAMSKKQIGASIVQGEASIVLWPTYFILPIGFGLIFLILAHKFFAYLFAHESGLDTQRATPAEVAAD
ncbi:MULTISPECIES: TRAP transporter small permease [Noviherbaspirillum]|uniref:TRAP transporter small permease n=1 Tax=Noviherbaspirillum TaxID=1344552 RepID=UPI001CEF6703|nr:MULTISPECIES: TRAP transporter small permease [Noviherbaspirillum]